MKIVLIGDRVEIDGIHVATLTSGIKGSHQRRLFEDVIRDIERRYGDIQGDAERR